jgi:hypothetical protein
MVITKERNRRRTYEEDALHVVRMAMVVMTVFVVVMVLERSNESREQSNSQITVEEKR